jgi:hypothetical protein
MITEREEKRLIRRLEAMTGVPVREARTTAHDGHVNVCVVFAGPACVLSAAPADADGVLRITVGGPP